jgi:hypothetical protein
MTKEDFEIHYAQGSDLTVKEIRALGVTFEPCDCGVEGCLGWQAVTQKAMKDRINEYRTQPTLK